MDYNNNELAERQKNAIAGWMSNFRNELLRQTWRDMAKKFPDKIRISNGFVHENTVNGWRIVGVF